MTGIDSEGTAGASFFDEDPADGDAPDGSGLSEFSVSFEVTGDPVKFSLTGTISASASATNAECTEGTVTSPDGSTHTVSSPAGCGSPESANVGDTGELLPGSHSVSVQINAPASGPASDGTASAEYDIALRFCTIVIDQPNQTTEGTTGDDVICGTSGDDTINGLGGNDTIYGLGGADTLEGGDGDDHLFGDEGNEHRIYGGYGNDTIDGGPGNDGDIASLANVVAGGGGNDDISGGPGDDTIFGRCGEDLGISAEVCPADPPLLGETDQDDINGQDGKDSIHGDADLDDLAGGRDRDNLFGGPARDHIDGGPGNELNTGPSVNVAAIQGGCGPDVIFGGPGDDLIEGNDGNDEIRGEAGSDKLRGHAGNDCLVGDSSVGVHRQDVLLGHGGDDKFLARDGVHDVVRGGPGPDKGRFDPQDDVESVQNRNFQGGC
jgi:Ca2+-binding RTX toxin-like protein